MKKGIKRSGKVRKNKSSKKNSSTKSVKRKNLRKSGGSRKSSRKTHSKGGANPMIDKPKFWHTLLGKTVRNDVNYVSALDLSADEKIVVAGYRDGTIQIWDVESRAELHTLPEIKLTNAPYNRFNSVSSLALSANGKTIVSGSVDGAIRFWDTQSGELKKTIPEERFSGIVNAIAFSDDEKTIISSAGNDIRIIDAESGRIKQTLNGHKSPVKSISMFPDNKKFASGSYDKTVKIWGASQRFDRWGKKTGKELLTLSGHTDWVNSVAVSADGRTVVSGSHDNNVIIWDGELGKKLLTLSGHMKPVFSVAISANGNTVVSGSADNTIKIWDIESGKVLYTLDGPSRHTAIGTGLVSAVTMSADGKTIVAGGDAVSQIWKLPLKIGLTKKAMRVLGGLPLPQDAIDKIAEMATHKSLAKFPSGLPTRKQDTKRQENLDYLEELPKSF